MEGVFMEPQIYPLIVIQKSIFFSPLEDKHCWNMVQELSHVRRILSACENGLRNKTWVLWPQFLQIKVLFLAYVSCFSQVWIGGSLLQTLHYCLLLLTEGLNDPVYSLVEKHVFVMCGLSLWMYTAQTHESFTHVIFLSPQSINCLMLWIKLAIYRDFSQPHLSVPFFHIPLLLDQCQNITYKIVYNVVVREKKMGLPDG